MFHKHDIDIMTMLRLGTHTHNFRCVIRTYVVLLFKFIQTSVPFFVYQHYLHYTIHEMRLWVTSNRLTQTTMYFYQNSRAYQFLNTHIQYYS